VPGVRRSGRGLKSPLPPGARGGPRARLPLLADSSHGADYRDYAGLPTAKSPAPIADQALARIARLYEVEAEIRGEDPLRRRGTRQARSAPLLDDLKAWLEARLGELSGGSPTAKAIRYALGHWQLSRFLDDGRIELDTTRSLDSIGDARSKPSYVPVTPQCVHTKSQPTSWLL
jgi:hypothetical protein